MEPSSLTDRVAYGSVTRATCGSFPSSRTVSWTAFFASGPVILPSSARNTTRAVAPSAFSSGKRSSSRSYACCASVPGIEKSFGGAAGAFPASTPVPTSSTTHSNATSRCLRKEIRPSRERNVATAKAPRQVGVCRNRNRRCQPVLITSGEILGSS